MDKSVVKELIQREMNYRNIKNELDVILKNKEKRDEIINDYQALKLKLGDGKTSEAIAEAIFKFLSKI